MKVRLTGTKHFSTNTASRGRGSPHVQDICPRPARLDLDPVRGGARAAPRRLRRRDRVLAQHAGADRSPVGGRRRCACGRAERARRGPPRPDAAGAGSLRRGVPAGRRHRGDALQGDAELGPHRRRGGGDAADDLRRLPRPQDRRPRRAGRSSPRHHGDGDRARPRQHRLDEPPRQDGRAQGGGEEPHRRHPGRERKRELELRARALQHPGQRRRRATAPRPGCATRRPAVRSRSST